MKVPDPPGSGKGTAEGKGVHREVKSEGSWMWEQTNHGQTFGLTNGNHIKSHIRQRMRVRLLNKAKPDNYTESCGVNVAGRRRKRNVWYPGMPAQDALERATVEKATLNTQESAEVIVGMIACAIFAAASIVYPCRRTVHCGFLVHGL